MSDRFDGDPDDFFEPDDEQPLGPDDPAEGYDEGSLGTEAPRPTAPQSPDVGIETEDALPDYEDVDAGLRRRFWVLVAAIKLTLLALTGGLLFLFVEGNTLLGSQLLGFGLLLSAYTVYRYREAKATLDEENEDAVDSGGRKDAADNGGDGTAEASEGGAGEP